MKGQVDMIEPEDTDLDFETEEVKTRNGETFLRYRRKANDSDVDTDSDVDDYDPSAANPTSEDDDDWTIIREDEPKGIQKWPPGPFDNTYYSDTQKELRRRLEELKKERAGILKSHKPTTTTREELAKNLDDIDDTVKKTTSTVTVSATDSSDPGPVFATDSMPALKPGYYWKLVRTESFNSDYAAMELRLMKKRRILSNKMIRREIFRKERSATDTQKMILKYANDIMDSLDAIYLKPIDNLQIGKGLRWSPSGVSDQLIESLRRTGADALSVDPEEE